MDLVKASLKQISAAVKAKDISAVEVARFFRNRIDLLDSQLNAFITVNESAENQAAEIDAKISRGENPGLLAGVPFGIKDMFCTKGLRTTAGSKMLENFIPPYDATVVANLKRNGATILGKLNQDEFAMGSSNETSFFGAVKNPWDAARVPGGSSGGSAAAQAARLAAATLGTDTGGSIRQPANFCGIVGVKPTYGRASRYGIVSYASSLDQAGPMVSCVEDAALVLEVICGKDERDSTTSEKEVPRFSEQLSPQLKGLKIGVMSEYVSRSGIHPDTLKTVESAIAFVKDHGAEIVDVSVPLTEYGVAMYYLISASECSSNLARYDGVKFGHRAHFENLGSIDLAEFYDKTRAEAFGNEVKRRIMLGTYCLSSGYYDAFYSKACRVRRLLRNQYVEAFKKCDVILSPVTTRPAFKFGERSADPLAMYMNDVFTVSTNLAGLPGMSVPFGMSGDLPVGVQLTAEHFDEQTMLNVAFALEQGSSVSGRVPHVI